ncbi:NAD-dependent epimerase/dehydratase family protein [Phyllobacterium leguminum]|uniref:dTDP-6-deoxy-L-talose 4-dehydrogenase (NAD+) n=1 Tax=Phyllobacterium leguminum TaxID=314237 RepID=A0A318STG4_9HYPH|nr:NAD-dependent epimerase/dehydratase family protein [Phyllobacterium leguminum]PYE85241.1 dTDP-6-deoxy-L-talose 4-dehydrogenase (NAD+) [Phyllobacterium leguminum]
MAPRIIVTGGSGFIGSRVCAKLAADGWEVQSWTRGRTKRDSTSSADRIECLKIDIYDEAAVRTALKEAGAKQMIHLAWGGLPNYLSCHHMDTELVRQIGFVRSVIEGGIEHLTLTGTCFEYGARDGELREDMDGRPTNPYGYAKLALLRYVEFLRREMPFSYRWLRLFYMYGEGQGPTSLYTLLRAAYARGDPTFDMSDGHQIRDFMPVGEVVSKIIALHAADVPDGVFNVCSGHPVSVRQQVEKWISDWGYDVQLNLGKLPIPPYEQLAFWGSNDKTNFMVMEKN